ncbi:MAG: hypothetical protein JWN30_937, partial [Bacilli bacterium]|nr:hypothetical protein [Bacilli bacterium]
MDINSLFRFGNLAVNMLGTPQFKKMAKFAVPFLSAPAQPAEGVTGDGAAPAPQAPPAANYSPAAANPWGAGPWGAPRPPQRPGMPQFGAARPGMPGRGGHPRLGGLEALRGFMGGGAAGQRPPGMGMQNPGQPGNLPAGIPVKNLMKYATPQNLQKVMEWQKVAKQVMGMFGGSSVATTA